MKHTASFISSCHYRISDKTAGALAKSVDRSLPAFGRELSVPIPGIGKGWLNRTPYSPEFRTDAPARGWVWCVWGIQESPKPAHHVTAELAILGPQFSFEL